MAAKTYADFSGGWYGSLDPAKVPDNMYDARNMIVYRDGSIGPRPGLRLFDLGRDVVEPVYAVDTRRNISQPTQTFVIYMEAKNNEIQRLTEGGALTSYTLTYSGQTTSSISSSATATQIQSALEALSNIAPGDVAVVQISATVFDVYFQGALGGTDVTQMTSTPTDGTLTVSTPQAGGSDTSSLRLVTDDNLGTLGAAPSGDSIGIPPAGFPANMYHKSNFRTFIHVPGIGIYRFQQGIVAALDVSSGTRVGTTSGVRVLRDEDGTLNLFYSNPSDPTTWGALDFITIAEDPGASIVNISELNNYVVIVTDYGGWYMLSGVPGINDVLRQVYQDLVYPSPWGFKAFVTTSENELFGLSPDNNYPVMFNGSKLDQLRYLSMTPDDPQASYAENIDTVHQGAVAVHGPDPSSPAFVLPDPANLMLMRTNGAWGLHEFEAGVHYAWTSNGGRLYGFSKVAQITPVPPATGQIGLTADFTLNRPAFVSDTHAQPGDLSDTPIDAYFTLPETWSETSDPITVSEVVVDFKRFDTGTTENNNITITVTALARGDDGITEQSQAQTWTQPVGSSTEDGVADRIRKPFGEQGAGAGYRVKLSDIRGVAIREVVVHTRADNNEGRAH